MTLANEELRRTTIANLAKAVLDAKTIGQQSEGVEELLVELKASGYVETTADWCFEPDCREHGVVHLWSDATGCDAWLEVCPDTGEVKRL